MSQVLQHIYVFVRIGPEGPSHIYIYIAIYLYMIYMYVYYTYIPIHMAPNPEENPISDFRSRPLAGPIKTDQNLHLVMRFSTDSEVFCVVLEVFTQKQQVDFRNGLTHVFCHIAWLFDSSILQIRTFPAMIPFPNPHPLHPFIPPPRASCKFHASTMHPDPRRRIRIWWSWSCQSYPRGLRENYPPNMAQVTFVKVWRCFLFKCFVLVRNN